MYAYMRGKRKEDVAIELFELCETELGFAVIVLALFL